MTPLEALRKALEALDEINRTATSGGDPAELVDDISAICGDIAGELTLAGYVSASGFDQDYS